MTDKIVRESGGIGLAGILTIIFVLCKIFGVIDWSWWWVFSPLWISALVVLFFLFIGLIVLAIAVVWSEWK